MTPTWADIIELTEMNSKLAAVLAPAILGTVGGAYLLTVPGTAAVPFFEQPLQWIQDKYYAATAQAGPVTVNMAVVASAVTVTAAVAVGVVSLGGGTGDAPEAAPGAQPLMSFGPSGPGSRGPGDTDESDGIEESPDQLPAETLSELEIDDPVIDSLPEPGAAAVAGPMTGSTPPTGGSNTPGSSNGSGSGSGGSASAGDSTDPDDGTEQEPEPEPEPIVVEADAPTQNGNVVTIPGNEGVRYTDTDGNTLTGGVPVGPSLVINAVADDGYELAEGPSEWTFYYPIVGNVSAGDPTMSGTPTTMYVETNPSVSVLEGSGSVEVHARFDLDVNATFGSADNWNCGETRPIGPGDALICTLDWQTGTPLPPLRIGVRDFGSEQPVSGTLNITAGGVSSTSSF